MSYKLIGLSYNVGVTVEIPEGVDLNDPQIENWSVKFSTLYIDYKDERPSVSYKLNTVCEYGTDLKFPSSMKLMNYDDEGEEERYNKN
jgi:hypothetical protein